jgi:arylsulfatase A-like enzyme/Tfp pilus assembly protein PilF
MVVANGKGGVRKHPNVLLITIDTLRWDHVGAYGSSAGTTPAIDRLAAGGTRFDTAIAHVPLTAPSHASILTGLTPLRHGVRDNGAFVLPPDIPSMASMLRAAGYATAGFVSGFPLDRRFGFAAGFEAYDDRFPASSSPAAAAHAERRANATTDRALAWLDRHARSNNTGEGSTQPWFLWIHYFDPHAAYDPPSEWRTKIKDPYDGEIAFVDDQIRRLLERIASLERGTNTVVALTADHGESLGEHGEETHGVFIYDATLRVPLIFSGPGVPVGAVVRTLARGVDVMPTVLDLSGVASPSGLDGRSLRDAMAGRTMTDEPAYIESLLAERNFGWAPLRGLRDPSWKYIDAPEPELYDLRSDAGELQNRALASTDRVAAFERQLTARAQKARTPDAARQRTADAREAAERLRSLGYVAGPSRTSTPASRRNPKSGIALINRLERGIAAVRTNPAQAASELRSVLAEDGAMAIARSQLASALAALGDHEGAIDEVRRLQQQNAASAEDVLLLSESYRALGRTHDAEHALRQAAALDPESPEVALTEARAALARREFDRASAAFSRTLQLSPDHPEALVGLGDLALARGDLASASAQYERVLSRDPGERSAALGLGLVRGRQGRMQEAITLLAPVVEAMPRNGEALAALAAALARTGRFPEAVRYFERAVAAGQQTPPVLNGLGFARLEAGDRDGALDALKRSLAAAPDQPRIEQAIRDISARK